MPSTALQTRSSQDEQELDRPAILQSPWGYDLPVREEDGDRTHHSQGGAIIAGGEAGGDRMAGAATFLSVADDELRSDLQAALAVSEPDFIGRIARSWERLCALLGYRLRPDLDATFETFASLISASLRGLVLMALSTPDIATRRINARPFGAIQTTEWSLPAIALTSLALAFLEPDPTIDWTDERLASVRGRLASLGAADG